MKGGIASRLAIIFSLLLLVATATVGVLVFWGARQSLIEASTDRLAHTAETIEVRFFTRLEAIRKDVLFLAETPPVQGIVRAQAGPWINRRRKEEGRLDALTNHSDVEWSDQLTDIFSVFLENRPSCFRVALIGLAEGGRELVRVERRAGLPHRADGDELRQQGEQGYFTEAVNLPPENVYLSEIDLVDQAGEGLEPGVPMLRAAAPIYDADGRAFGILVVHVDFRHVLRTLTSLVDSDVSLYLANNRGDLLVHPDSARVFGSGRRPLMQGEFPRIASWFGASGAALQHTALETDAPILAYFQRIAFNSEADPHYLVLGATSPRDRILAGVTRVRNRSVLITVLFALWGIVLALVFSRYLTRPLRQVTQAISRFGGDERPMELPVSRQDEIGVLARAFDTMARQIQAQIQELEDKARRQRIILETSAEGIIVTDAQGRIETFNRAAELIFGYRAEQVAGLPVNLLIFNLEPEGRTNGQAPTPDEDRWRLGHGQEVTGRRKDGSTFPLSLALSSFELGGEKKFAGFVQDITRRKQYEETLRQAKLTAEAASKAKSAFLANMSHEIRTPLTGIIGFASLLARQVSGKHRKYARLIESSGERLKETLNSVLDLAKLEANKMEVDLVALDVSDEVQAVVQLFQGQAQQKDLTLSHQAAPAARDARARLDRGAFSSILHNLIGNAIKFTSEGGVFVSVEADDERVYVRVQDTGVGIDPDFMPYLFDVFRQESTGLSRTHEGSGLGLSITQRLVRLLEGEIGVESQKGKGSTFTVSFPRHRPEAAEEPPEEAAAPALRLDDLPRQKVLLVEDNEHTQYLIESLLEDAFSVTVVADAEQALLEAFRTEFDMVLLDINLGEGPNGADVLRELRAMPAYRTVPIAAVTAYALPGDRERFLEMGFSAYLSKPFNAEELLALTARL